MGQEKAVNQLFVGELGELQQERLGHVTAPARMEAVNLITRLGVGIASCRLASRQQKPHERRRGWAAEFRGGDKYTLGVSIGSHEKRNPRA